MTPDAIHNLIASREDTRHQCKRDILVMPRMHDEKRVARC